MILYHGTNLKINKVNLEKCRKYKDFGQGFYCTTIKEQAEFMAIRTTKRFGGKPYINAYELDERIFNDKELNIRIFDKKPTKEWAQFIVNNRDRNFKHYDSKNCNQDNKYDMVVGPVADDDIVVLINSYGRGLIDEKSLLKELTYKELTNQYSFHTERALKYLKEVKEDVSIR